MMETRKTLWILSNHHGSHHMRGLGFNLERSRRLAQILRDSMLLFMDSSETTIMMDNGKTLTKERFQKISTVRMSITLIHLPKTFCKTTQPRESPMMESQTVNSLSQRINQSNSLKKSSRPTWEWKVSIKITSWKRSLMKPGSIMMSTKKEFWMPTGPLHSWDTFARVRRTLICNDPTSIY